VPVLTGTGAFPICNSELGPNSSKRALLSNKIWEIEDYQVKEFVGNYEEWEEFKARKLKEEKGATAPSAKPQKVKADKPKQEPATPIDKEHKKELQKVQKQFQQIEERTASLTKQQQELEAALTLPEIYSDKNKFLKAEADYKRVAVELKKATAEYETVFEKLMNLEASQ